MLIFDANFIDSFNLLADFFLYPLNARFPSLSSYFLAKKSLFSALPPFRDRGEGLFSSPCSKSYMILRGGRLCRANSIRAFESLRTISNFRSLDSSRVQLCPAIVQSTVSACPSDTIALSFFLWCARQLNYFHDSCSFDRMIPVVCRLTNRFGSASGIFRELEVVGCSMKAQTFMILMRIYWRGNFYELALQAFDEMVKRNYVPNTFARNIVLDILFKTIPLDVAMKFFRDMDSPNFLSYNIVLSNLCRSSDWMGASAILREMVEKGFDLNTSTFTVAFDCFCKARRFMELLQLLAFMVVSGKQPTVTIWTILIDSLCRDGKIDSASTLLQKMIELGCSPTLTTYTLLIKGLFKFKKFDKVSLLLDTMLSNNCNPDLVFYNVLIDCFTKSRMYEDAFEVFLHLRDRKLKPDAYTLSSLVCALCSSGKLSFLPKLIADLDISVDLVACNSLINAFCKAGMPTQAIDLFIDMLNRGYSPDNYSYAGLLNGFCMLGRTEEAVNAYRSFVTMSHDVDAYVHAVIITGLVKQKKYHMANRLFMEAVLQNYHLDVVSYTIAITGLLRESRFMEAWSLFDQMKHYGVAPNLCTYNVMLYGFCKARDTGSVKQCLRDMETAGFDLDHISYNTILHLLIKLRRYHSALNLCRRMYDLGMMPNGITYSLLLDRIGNISGGELEHPPPKVTSNSEYSFCLESSSSDSGNELLICSGN